MARLMLFTLALLFFSGCTVHTTRYSCSGADCPQPRTVVVHQPVPQQRVAYVSRPTARKVYVDRRTHRSYSSYVTPSQQTRKRAQPRKKPSVQPRKQPRERPRARPPGRPTPQQGRAKRGDKVRKMTKCMDLPNGRKKCKTKHHEN